MQASFARYDSPSFFRDGRVARVRVKICGITRPSDAEAAALAGADAIGIVFYPKSPRFTDTGAAREIAAALGAFVTTVALFVNPEAEEVERVVSVLRPGLLQFHGDESPAFCERFGLPYMKVLRVGTEALDASVLSSHPSAAALLLDTLDTRQHGGTGRRFDWSLVPREAPRPLVLAGGLDAANVESAIHALRPWAVDVSSGVETAPGRKDPGKIEEFMRAVARANAALPGPDAGADAV